MHYYVEASWGAREEAATQIALRLQRMLAELADLHPGLSGWFDKGKSRKDALSRPIDPASLEALEAAIVNGVNRTDSGRVPIPELGFTLGAWNGTDVALTLHVGEYSKHSNLGNHIRLTFDGDGDTHQFLLDTGAAVRAALALADVWHPEIVTISTSAVLDAQLDRPGTPRLFLGWLTWFTEDPTQILPDIPAVRRAHGWTIAASPSISDVTAADVLAIQTALRS